MTESWLHLRDAANFIEDELLLSPGAAEALLVEFCGGGSVQSKQELASERDPIIADEWTGAGFTDRLRGTIVTRSGKIIEGVKVNARELSLCVAQRKETTENSETLNSAETPYSLYRRTAIRKRAQERRVEETALLEVDPISYVEAFEKAGRGLFGVNWIGAASEDDKVVLKFGARHRRFIEADRRNEERELQFERVERWLTTLGLVIDIRGHRYVSRTMLDAALAEYAGDSVTLTPSLPAPPDDQDDRPEILTPENIPTASAGIKIKPGYKTGLAGKPTSWHLVEQECRRRFEAGERHDKTSEWAQALQKWLSETHPSAPQLKKKTLTNRLAPLLRELKA